MAIKLETMRLSAQRKTRQLTRPVPERLSDWARLALRDLRQVAKRANVRIDMSQWCLVVRKPNTDEAVCTVCLAGAVILKALSGQALLRPDENFEDITPSGFTSDGVLRSQLRALDMLRCGDLLHAVSSFYCPRGDTKPEMLIEFGESGLPAEHYPVLREYNADFVRVMRERIALLSQAGF